jgi:hypothetical protein
MKEKDRTANEAQCQKYQQCGWPKEKKKSSCFSMNAVKTPSQKQEEGTVKTEML